MPEFTIGSPSGASVDIDAENFMIALGMGLPKVGVDLNGHNRWVIVPAPAGAMFVEDSMSGARYVIKPRVQVKMVVARAAPPQPRLADSIPPVGDMGLPPEEGLPEDNVPVHSEPTEEAPFVPAPPMFTMQTSLAPPPGASRRQPTDIDGLAEKLFDLSTDIAGAPPEEAAQRALETLQQLLPAEASSIARGSIADFHLTIVAATGPVGEKIKGRVVPFGEGYTGLCFDARVPVVVNDVKDDPRHHLGLDEDTGFVTKAVLCVPIVRGDDIFGVLQVLNPEYPFIPEDEELAAQVAQTLAIGFASAAESLE